MISIDRAVTLLVASTVVTFTLYWIAKIYEYPTVENVFFWLEMASVAGIVVLTVFNLSRHFRP